ncbi:uncharacterized protein LOC110096765 [Dendrobium catenatum]|uniref:uncharacterized protein LOC110096765 n=1 Tax=Dendrobium catenatum TaxID=906689 RepID=UPI0009F41E38|nr:uncharacterized protein LOC110096765 [Dendrobium catenatum]
MNFKDMLDRVHMSCIEDGALDLSQQIIEQIIILFSSGSLAAGEAVFFHHGGGHDVFPPLPGSSVLGSPPSKPQVSYAQNLANPSANTIDFPMSFVSPSKKLSFKAVDFTEGANIWTHSLVGYSIGQRPNYERLLAAMNKLWVLKGSFSLLSMADGFFLLKFTSAEDMELVFSGGPWFLLGKPFILQKWNPKFKPNRDEDAAIPIWIKIMDLPLALWTPSGISKIASYIGVPLSVDTLTARRTRLTFARVCVHITKNSLLPEVIPIDMDGEDINLKVVYDWKPTPCEGCGSLFHPFAPCSSNPDPKQMVPSKVLRGRSRSRNHAARPLGNTSKPPISTSMNPSPASLPTNSQVIIIPSSENVPTSSPSPVIPKDPSSSHIADMGIVPNLNLPNVDTSIPNTSSSSKVLLPSQVILTNSFSTLLTDSLPAKDRDDEEVPEEEDLSSSHTVESNHQKSSGSSSTNASAKKVKSPPKKTKAKNTTKKAKNPR